MYECEWKRPGRLGREGHLRHLQHLGRRGQLGHLECLGRLGREGRAVAFIYNIILQLCENIVFPLRTYKEFTLFCTKVQHIYMMTLFVKHYFIQKYTILDIIFP